jgi:catechol 2,3-dioxygenase-like lactoylglutathione lyase family enzyme
VSIRFAHVNVIAQDWRRLVDFYQTVFGCEPVPPERDQKGEWLDRVTGVAGTHIRGLHLRLPGGGATLEVYGYDEVAARPEIRPNTPGFSHIAFRVDDLAEIARRVAEQGGGRIGEVGEVVIEGVGKLTLQYLTDPEGNIIEVQQWT